MKTIITVVLGTLILSIMSGEKSYGEGAKKDHLNGAEASTLSKEAKSDTAIVDPLGHKLLEERIQACGSVIAGMLETPSSSRMPEIFKEYIVTGIGSSQAHARYFEDLINRYTSARARYVPFSAFLKDNLSFDKDSTLVVFSQGLSPNAYIALRREDEFKHTVIFTAKEVIPSKKQTVVKIPVKDEYQLLVRVIGPMVGYLSVIQFINENWPNSIPEVSKEELLLAINKADQKVRNMAISDNDLEGLKQGPIILTHEPINEYGQNLAFKLLEGPFLPMPGVVEYLDFSHGPFQQLVSSPRGVILLRSKSKTDEYLYAKLKSLLERSRAPVWEVYSSLPSPWSILEFEAVLNHFMLKVIKEFKVNQRDWPGKGEDGSLYCIKE